MKPLKGVDKALEANLESFFRISYPKFEILFSVDSKSDPAVQVVKRLIDKHPTVDAKLVYCEQTSALFLLFMSTMICLNDSCKQKTAEESGAGNPKINNLLTSYSQAKYGIVWQSDSNIIVTPHELTRMVHCLDPNVGLVHQVWHPPLCFSSFSGKIH